MVKCNTINIVISSINNVNLVIQQQIASSISVVPLNVKIGIMIKSNTPMINIVIDSVNSKSCNTTTNSLRQALLYLINKSSSKCGNWYGGKALYPKDQHCDKISVNCETCKK